MEQNTGVVHVTDKQQLAQRSQQISKIPFGLSSQDQTILAVKYIQAPISRLDLLQAVGIIQGLIKRIKVIAGWNIPELKEDLEILYAELYQHFCENWPTVNAEEVAFAFRKYGSEVNNWGKDINLVLLDQIIGKYMAERREIGIIEERQSVQEDPSRLIEPVIDWVKYAEDCYQTFLSGKKFNLRIWSAAMYDEFVRGNMIGAESWKRYQDAAIKWQLDYYGDKERQNMMSKDKYLEGHISAKIEAILEQQEAFCETEPMAKKICILEYFKTIKEKGRKTLLKK